jgi:hypothetical protein
MKKVALVLQFILVGLMVTGCLEPYNPRPSSDDPDYLVIDAFIDVNTSSASVSIMHTLPLTSTLSPQVEENALVSLIDENGIPYELFFNGGLYTIQAGLPVDPEKKYKLYIRSASGKEYESDFINLKSTPPIDSVNYVIDGDEVHVNVNTHDPSGESRFYKWDYIETFQYRSNYASQWLIENGIVIRRPVEKEIYTCYRTDPSKDIFVGTTKRLAEDLVQNQNLVKIQKGSIKTSVKYSILVRQQSITEEAYDYWSELKKTTENLGGLFDPMPSSISGNIRCITDPDEPVIGYFSGSSISEKRIFIEREDLPGSFSYLLPICQLDTIFLEDLPKVTNPDALIYPINVGLVLIGYTTSVPKCIDCRQVADGVLTKPDFWE